MDEHRVQGKEKLWKTNKQSQGVTQSDFKAGTRWEPGRDRARDWAGNPGIKGRCEHL